MLSLKTVRMFSLFLAVFVGVMGVLAVIVGAIAAHNGLSYIAANWIEIGLRYHLPHMVAIWAALLALNILPVPYLVARDGLLKAAMLWALGCVLFSGGLYLQAFSGINLRYVIPMGGSCMMFGWVYAARVAYQMVKVTKSDC